MAKQPLNLAQILKAEEALIKAFRSVSTIRRDYGEAGALIQLPRIPPLISESIVYWMLKSRSDLITLDFRKSGRDLIGTATDGSVMPIEVKATGRQAFQHFSQKDITSRWLVWVHFQRYFEEEEDPILVYLFQEVGNEFLASGRVTLSKVLAKIPQDRQEILIESETISDLLSHLSISQTDLPTFLG